VWIQNNYPLKNALILKFIESIVQRAKFGFKCDSEAPPQYADARIIAMIVYCNPAIHGLLFK